MTICRHGFYAPLAGGVPEFVQAGTAYNADAGASHTFGYTCAVSPGSNRLLVLAFAYRENHDPDTFDTLTYNGVTLSLGATARHTGPTPDVAASIYYLLHTNIPNDGASHNFVANFAGADSGPFLAIMMEYINVAQGAPHRTGTDILGGAAPTVSLATVAVNALLIDCAAVPTNRTYTPGSDQNERVDHIDAGSILSQGSSDKLPAAHAGGTVAMSQAISGGAVNSAYAAVAWEPA